MSSEGERVAVQTYVSSNQRVIWREEAEELDMSQAEYLRSMVQAGRRSFDLGDGDTTGSGTTPDLEARSPDATPGVGALEDRILDVLRREGAADWDSLLAGVTDDVEERLECTLDDLQADDRIRYSGREGGYVEVEDGS